MLKIRQIMKAWLNVPRVIPEERKGNDEDMLQLLSEAQALMQFNDKKIRLEKTPELPAEKTSRILYKSTGIINHYQYHYSINLNWCEGVVHKG